jgi:hypothetical protein
MTSTRKADVTAGVVAAGRRRKRYATLQKRLAEGQLKVRQGSRPGGAIVASCKEHDQLASRHVGVTTDRRSAITSSRLAGVEADRICRRLTLLQANVCAGLRRGRPVQAKVASWKNDVATY